MRRLYQYRGTVGVMSAVGQTAEEITLYDSNDDSKAPTRLNVYGGLAKYIYELEMTDAEERYLDADYVYDWNLALVRIEIPSNVPSIPAKNHRAAGTPRARHRHFRPARIYQHPGAGAHGQGTTPCVGQMEK